MSTRSQLTKDLNESVKALLGKHIKILLKNVVKLETKADKTENRVLVFSPCRLFLLTAKVPTRIDSHFHYLEIQAIESKKNNQLVLTVGEKAYSFLTHEDSSSQEVDAMISALATAIRNIFPSVPLMHIIRKVDVQPAMRLQQLVGDMPVREGDNHGPCGPCGGFSTQYACMCDYHGMPYREEVSWDVDTIYLSHDTRELCLRDFDHLDPKDLVPIISALEFNTWFTKLRASSIKLTHEALDRILHVCRRTVSLEELYLDNLGIKWDFVHKLSIALMANQNTPLHTLDLSNNIIEDKGANHLSSPLARLPKGLVHLNLSHCSLSSKGVNQLAHSLFLNQSMPNTLTYLNLSGNNLKEEINNLCNFLAQPNVIAHLDISGTDTILESIFGALLRGCATNLVHLNVSRNAFSTKKAKEVPPSFKQFFTSTLSLKHLNISQCKLPLEALKILGISTKINFTAGMDADLASVVTAVSKNKSIRHLAIGRNLAGCKARHVAAVMDAVVQMIQEDDCVLQSLAIPDSKLKGDLYNLINALGSNQCLQTIDISGNLMGDAGARLLAKALQINSRLRTIIYDRNGITLQGYCDIAYALESNYTVRYMPFPVHDIVPCMKTSAERTDTVMRKIQDLLHRNVSPKKYSNGQAFRLQQLLPRLQEAVQRREEAAGGPLDTRLRQVADDVHNEAVSCLQGALDAMLRCAEEQCPHVVDSRLQQEIRRACTSKNHLPAEFVRSAVIEQAGTDIINKINELNLAVAAHVSDRVTDEVIEMLSRTYKSLVGDSGKKRSSTPDVLRTRSRVSSDSCHDPSETYSMADTISQQSDQSPMATPHLSTKRKSLHGRKLRPKSVVDSVEGLSADDIPDLLPSLPKSAEESLDSVAELPTSSGQQLQHLVKGRPRRAKTRAPSRPMLRPADSAEMHHLGEGLDSFFRPGSVTPTGTPLVSPTSDDSSHTFPLDDSPNHSTGGGRDECRSSRPSGCNAPGKCGPEDDKGGGTAGCGTRKEVAHSSPLLKGVSGLLEPTPRSRSSDNLEKCSPLIGRRSQGDSPLTASPLARRLLGHDEKTDDKTSETASMDGPEGASPRPGVAARLRVGAEKRNSGGALRQSFGESNSGDRPPSPTVRPTRLRATGLADSLRSPPAAIPKEISKSPVLRAGVSREPRTETDSCCGSKQCIVKGKPPPPIAPKPRPWSMAGDRKSGEFSLLSDGSSTNTSAANTPDSGDALDESTDSGVASMGSAGQCAEKRSVRELAATLNKHGNQSDGGKGKICDHSDSGASEELG
ncbi:Leucine-rich repeat-containing protein 16A [Gryllus bimaculatus]|nr:Leucine-rich repeat-containing protein 16A [Gryllus bimaculatus]